MLRNSAFALFALTTFLAGRAGATEICGNDIDDDGNGMTDEGCAPTLTTNVCESPLSCMETGMVSWSSGALHYDLPPDVAPQVPYGPPISLRRFYTSMSSPGSSPTSVNKTPLGDHWQHTYLTYMDRYLGGDGFYRAVLHTNDGRDIIAKTTSTVSGWEVYVPQAGFHVMSWKHNTASPNQWQVQLLTGETIVYNSVGQVTELWDNMQPTPNKVLITWDSTTNGNVSTVTDALGKRRLSFSYANGLMTSVQYQAFTSSSWVTQHTTSYDYSPVSVTKDATSGWYVPASATEWTNLLAGSSFANPTSLWLLQQTSGSLADSLGSSPGTMTGGTYQVAVSGWSRKGIKMTTDGGTGYAMVASPNASTTSLLMAQVFSINTNPASGYRGLNCLGATKYEEAELVNGPKMRAQSGSNLATGTTNRSGTILVVTKLDHARGEFVVYTDAGDILRPTLDNQVADTFSYLLGDGVSSSDATLLYAAMFTGTGAELSDAQVANLMKRLKGGPGLTKVTIGGTVAQRMSYDGTGLLAKITDDPGNLIASFKYSSTVAGQTDVVATPRGTVGFEFSSSRTGCSGQTALYFNKANTTSCTTDTDCGAGAMCGGKTGSGATGTCFQAARCLTLSTSFNESVVTNVSPIGPAGGACSGACTDVAQYVWNTSPSNVIRATGTKDPLGNYTSATYDSNGMPSQIAYGDTDSDPTNGGFQRIVYFFYDSTYPGRLAEVRRKSDLDPSASSCSSSSSTGCARTLYAYNSTSKLLASITETGTTYNSSASTTSYSSQVNYSFDSFGRLSQIDGPVSPMKTTYSYFSNTDAAWQQRGFLHGYSAFKDGSVSLSPTVLSYDLWGNPTGVLTPDGTVSCQTFDADRGFLSQRREAMAGQSSCSTPDSSDLKTLWARDSALRITQLTRPDGSCMFWEYDTSGRLARTKRRDDCNAASSGDKEEYLYTDEGLLYEIDTYNSSGTITRKQLMSYYASRKLAGVTNPVDITKSTNLLYDAAGMVNEVDGAGSLGKTTYSISADRRVSSETRYKDSTNSDTWQLLYDWLGDQGKVTDADSKATQTVRDDLGRTVEIISPDMKYPTLRVYDAASRLTTVKEAFGGGAAQKNHVFTFDALSRPLNDDYSDTCPTGTAHAEIIRTYDGPLGGTCPGGLVKGCTRMAGHLAQVSASLMCSPSYSDGTLDQTTWYAFDDAGREIEEYISDDSGRTAEQEAEWTKNGALSAASTPSAFQVGWSFGSATSNSDLDRITAITVGRSHINVADTIKWFPYGPLQQYNWEATSGGSGLLTYITRNLAYRTTYVGNAELSSLSSALDAVTITEDAKGRVITRDYTPSDPTYSGLFDSYFLYDNQDRVTCETTTYQSTCPTSGSGLKNNQTGFTGAGDWTTLKRPVPGSSGFTNQFGLGTGTHQITSVNQSDGSPVLGTTQMTYDERGNRTYDDNTSTLTHDRRDYTYDGRGNVINVRGEYKTLSSWAFYDVASAFDAKNRRVFKSFYNETTLTTSTWFFYYDPYDRLTEIRYTLSTGSSTVYSIFDIFWLGSRPVLFWETDFPSGSTEKYYVSTDESGRPIKLWTWPSSGSTSSAWTISPTAWGIDKTLAGGSIFQPLLFDGQYQDPETGSYEDDGVTLHRPGLESNGYRTYDAFAGAYLQMDPLAQQTWSSYVYASSNPVGLRDPLGLQYTLSQGVNGQIDLCHDWDGPQDEEEIECKGFWHYGFPDWFLPFTIDYTCLLTGACNPFGGGGGGGGGGGDPTPPGHNKNSGDDKDKPKGNDGPDNPFHGCWDKCDSARRDDEEICEQVSWQQECLEVAAQAHLACYARCTGDNGDPVVGGYAGL